MYNSFATQWTVDRQTPLFMGLSRQGYWGGLPFSSPGDLPHPGLNACLLPWQVDSQVEPPGKLSNWYKSQKICYMYVFFFFFFCYMCIIFIFATKLALIQQTPIKCLFCARPFIETKISSPPLYPQRPWGLGCLSGIPHCPELNLG